MSVSPLAQVRQEAALTLRLWVKVLGTLEQNWCVLEDQPEGGVTLVFFDDLGQVFDWLDAGSAEQAEAALRGNGFSWMHETPSFLYASGMPVLPARGVRRRMRPV